MKTKLQVFLFAMLFGNLVQGDVVTVCQSGTPNYWQCLQANPDKNGVKGDVTKGDGVFIGGPGVLSGLPKDSAEAPALEPIPPPVAPAAAADKRLGMRNINCCQTSGKKRVCVNWHWVNIAQVGDEIRIVASSLWKPVRIGSASEPPGPIGSSWKHSPPLQSCYGDPGCGSADKDLWMAVNPSGNVTAAGYNYAGRFFWECGNKATTNPGSIINGEP